MTEKNGSKFVTWKAFISIFLIAMGLAVSAYGLLQKQINGKADKPDMCYIRDRVDQIYNLMLQKERGRD